MSLLKKIETVVFLIEGFSAGKPNLERMANHIKDEWVLEESAKTVVQDSRRAELNRVLHATRAFDTGLKLFLEKFGKKSAGSHSIGDYVKDLQRNAGPKAGFNQLDGNIAKRINDEVTNKRNTYCHESGAFPTKAEANFIISQILGYYSIIYGLEQ